MRIQLERRQLAVAALAAVALTAAGVGLAAGVAPTAGSTATDLRAIDVTGGGAPEAVTYANTVAQVDIPGVLSALVLPAAPGEARLGPVSLNGVRVLDAASVACGPQGPAVLLAPVAGVVLPSVPSADTKVTVPGVGDVLLTGEQVLSGSTRVAALTATVAGRTVTLLGATCEGYTPPNGAGAVGAVATAGSGTLGVTVEVSAVPGTPTASTPASTGAPAAARHPAAVPVVPAVPILPTPSAEPAGPGVAPAPSPVAGNGGVTG